MESAARVSGGTTATGPGIGAGGRTGLTGSNGDVDSGNWAMLWVRTASQVDRDRFQNFFESPLSATRPADAVIER